MLFTFVPNVIRSSVFISTIGTLWARFACLEYSITGQHLKTSMFVSPALAAWVGIMLEKKERRRELTVYVAQQAVESLFRMLISRKYIKPIIHLKLILFALSMSVLLYFQKNETNLMAGSAKSLMKLFIPVEISPDLPERTVIRMIVFIRRYLLRKTRRTPDTLRRSVGTYGSFGNLLEDEDDDRDVVCPHKANFHISCWMYTLIGFCRSFLLGLGIRGFFLLLPRLLNPKKLKRKGLLPLADEGSLRLALFLGSMSGISRGVQCIMRRLRGKEDGFNQLVAGFAAGLTFFLNGSTEVCMYVASKATEAVYHMLVNRGLMKPFPHGEVSVFTLSVAILFYNALVAPHDVRPSYLRFLSRTSGYTFANMAVWFTKVREAFRGGVHYNWEEYQNSMKIIKKMAEKNPIQ